jgi:hypothetical protein
MSGCYAIPNVKTDITGVFTNKFATDAPRIRITISGRSLKPVTYYAMIYPNGG